MAKPALIYRATYAAGSALQSATFQQDRWIIRSAYGVILGEIYDRKLKDQIAELLGIKEALV